MFCNFPERFMTAKKDLKRVQYSRKEKTVWTNVEYLTCVGWASDISAGGSLNPPAEY
jgi:hypothetical protein